MEEYDFQLLMMFEVGQRGCGFKLYLLNKAFSINKITYLACMAVQFALMITYNDLVLVQTRLLLSF